jgi:uncharacterized protein with NRDE domain
MCLIFLAFQHHPQFPIYLMANRDEFYQRPTARLHWWEEAPDLLAGKDLQAGGTWMGINKRGNFAALTNVRTPGAMKPAAPSRGELVTGFLQGSLSPADYAREVAAQREQYSGFNLLLGNTQTLWYVSTYDLVPVRQLTPGIYGLSNAALDTHWPKVAQGKAEFSRLLAPKVPDNAAMFQMMNQRDPAPDEQLPQTGEALPLERLLSARFIASESYGTRLTTRLTIDKAGWVEVEERSFHPPAPTRQVHFQTSLPTR